MRYLLSGLVLTSVCLLAPPAFSHHSTTAFYDQDQWVEFEGVVQRWLFRNPHPVLYVEAPDAGGEIRVFEISFPPATILAKRGWSSETFREGEVIRATGHPSKAPGTYGVNGGTIHREDGTEVR